MLTISQLLRQVLPHRLQKLIFLLIEMKIPEKLLPKSMILLKPLVDFKNTILIMTSNIGANYLLDGIDADGTIKPEAEELVTKDLRGHFRPEFLNRLDEIILFKPLTKDNISGIINLIVADLNHRLEDKQLSIELSPDAEQFIVDNAYDPIYGARPLKRYIQKYVETLSAKLILADQVQMGDTILIAVENGELVAKKKQHSV